MFNNNIISKSICVSVMGSVMLASVPVCVSAQMLVPESFSRMYSLAQNGNVEALRGSVHRGMNIDAMDENGDTGLCIAARRREAYTYNAFRAAGANPRHPCTQNVDGYEEFVNSSGVVSVNSTARDAYGKMGKENYAVSSWTWWGLGGLAVAGVAIAAASGGGGGGGGGDSSSGGSASPSAETISSAGGNLASQGSVTDSTNGSKINFNKYTVNNTNAVIDDMDLNKNMPENAKYLNVILQAKKGGSYTNAENIALNTQNGTVGMAAVGTSVVKNEGYIDVESKNASIGMMASESSEAINEGIGVVTQGDETNGISMAFTGNKEVNTIVGMYADTNSTATNDGEIKGTATTASGSTTSASRGTMIGMETMIINSGPTSVDYINTAKNNGKIELSAGVSGDSESSINVNIIGMGSYLDNGFLTGNKNINRAETSILENNGNIDLSYAGNYTTSSTKTLQQGTGGVVGMRSDANNKATNNGRITISLPNETTSTSTSEEYAVSAGMQSVHGGEITNSKNSYITINTNAYTTRGNYGMVSVKGSGTVSGLYTRDDHTIYNNGTINMNTSNSFAMASYNGGVVRNNGTINLGNETTSIYNKNVGLYGDNEGTFVTLVNSGEINVYSNATAAIENDFGGGTTVENEGTINIMRSATNSYVFAGNYSSAVNNGYINYYATSVTSGTSGSTSGSEFPKDYTLKVQHSAMSTKAVPLISTTTKTTSATETIENNGDISLFGSTEVAAMAVETTLGVATNNYNITVKKSEEDPGISVNSIGMYIYENAINGAKAVNNGSIIIGELNNPYVQYSAAMASKSKYTSSLNNQNSIFVYSDYSFGMYASGNTHLINNGTINLYGNHNVAFYSAGTGVGENAPQIYNETVNVYSPNAIGFAIAGNAELRKIGKINICSSSDCEALNVRETFNMFYVNGTFNIKDISVPAIDGGTLIKLGENGSVNNYTVLSTTTNGGYIFYGNGSSNASNQTTGVINLVGAKSYGMYSREKHEASNYGTINVTGANSYGMFADTEGNVVNGGRIVVDGANSYGMYATGGAEKMINNGTIIVNNGTSWGMYAVSEDGDFVNNGTIAGANRLNENVEDKEKTDTDSGSDSGTDVGGDSGGTGGGASPSSILRRSLIHVSGGSNIVNNGTISDTIINFDDYVDGDGTVSIGKGGKYVATSMSGTVYAHANITASGFDKEYINKDSFVGSDDGINLLSGSYLFDAAKVTNTDGNIDIVMNMKPFDSIIENSSVANYLNGNYEVQNREDVFNTLKMATNKGDFDSKLNRILGLDFVANISAQSLENERIISRDVSADLLDFSDEEKRTKVKAFAFKNSAKAKDNVVGYDDKTGGVYGFYDTKANDNIRAGFGIAASRAESKYDNSSSRYNNAVEFFAPVILKSNETKVMVKPKLGYAAGHYRREGEGNVHKADTKEYYYGADFAIKHDYDVGTVALEPNLGFDVTGIYFDNIKENNEGLRMESENMLSMQSSIGLNLKKKIEFASRNILSLSAGGKYIHEFGNKYRTSAYLANTIGGYEIVGSRMNRNYGLLNFKAEYMFENFDFNASVNMPVDSKQDTYYLFGLGYKI